MFNLSFSFNATKIILNSDLNNAVYMDGWICMHQALIRQNHLTKLELSNFEKAEALFQRV